MGPLPRAAVAALAAWLALLHLPPAAARRPGTLEVAADLWCPVTCEPGRGRDGYLVDLVREALGPHGYAVRYRVLPWRRALASAAAGRVDAVLGATPAEAGALVFPPAPQGASRNAFAVLEGRAWRYAGPGSLAGVVVGFAAGYDHGELQPALDAAAAARRALPATGEDPLAANLGRLLRREVDVVVEDANVLAHRLAADPAYARVRSAGAEAGADPFHVAFSPARADARALAALLAREVAAMRADGRLAALLARYGVPDWEGP